MVLLFVITSFPAVITCQCGPNSPRCWPDRSRPRRGCWGSRHPGSASGTSWHRSSCSCPAAKEIRRLVPPAGSPLLLWHVQ